MNCRHAVASKTHLHIHCGGQKSPEAVSRGSETGCAKTQRSLLGSIEARHVPRLGAKAWAAEMKEATTIDTMRAPRDPRKWAANSEMLCGAG
jgi:hypothetical protein